MIINSCKVHANRLNAIVQVYKQSMASNKVVMSAYTVFILMINRPGQLNNQQCGIWGGEIYLRMSKQFGIKIWNTEAMFYISNNVVMSAYTVVILMINRPGQWNNQQCDIWGGGIYLRMSKQFGIKIWNTEDMF